MNDDHIMTLCWPLSRLGEGIELLALQSGLTPIKVNPVLASGLQARDGIDLSRWIEWVSNNLGLESEPVESPVPEFKNFLRYAGPAIIQVKHQEEPRFLLLKKLSFGQLKIIGPDLSIHKCQVELLGSVICAPFEKPLIAEIEKLLTLSGIPEHKKKKVTSSLLRDRLAKQRIHGCWLLRLPPAASFWKQLSHARLTHHILTILLVFLLVFGLEIIGWTLIGQATIFGRLDLGWLSAWALFLFTMIPLQLAGRWLNSIFAVDLGKILKKRLLAGALNMNIEDLKHQGSGQFMSRVMESQTFESLSLNGGFVVIIAGIELMLAGVILSKGAGGAWHVFLLLFWLFLSLVLGRHYFHQLKKWTTFRLTMTHDLVEQMVGHRTRLAQEASTKRELEEDQVLQEYLMRSQQMDKSILPIVSFMPRGWLIISIAGLAPAFVYGLNNTVAIVVALGGILLGHRAFSEISSGLTALARAGIAWNQVSPLFHAARKKPSRQPFIASGQFDPTSSSDESIKLIDASELVFRYQPKSDPVLQKVNLLINKGDHILLMGDSGGGKSTMASLLAGLRRPESGLLLLNGLDQSTLGENWHRLVTEAPQYHENHILTGTLAFNLLMGRNWPPCDAELAEAHELCVELGLDDLLMRMPSGMMQMVGETGWQLSHGERSRIFLARALLQNTQLTILDESFAALDPESLDKCLTCVYKRAKTLLVIAHP